ncbi:Putative membrane protein YfcA [Klebsiella pneumoniae IS10]|nr:Putative membrane protein YfcA [Klebsiella pneumoniae IS10]
MVNLADQKLNILMTFIGSTAGALLVQHVQSDILKQILPLLVIGIGLYFLLMPKLGEATGSVGFTVCRLRWSPAVA